MRTIIAILLFCAVAATAQTNHPLAAVNTVADLIGPSTVIEIRYEWTTSADVRVISADVHYRVRGSPVAYTP